MNYSPLSARERTLIEEIERRDLTVFTPMEVSGILHLGPETVYRTLSRLEGKGAIVRIERGKYVTGRFYSELDLYEIAPNIVSPSYLSLWSGLHYYGFTDQVPETVYLVVTRRRLNMELQGRRIQFISVRRELFFGYRRFKRIVVAEPEKLLIDCIAFPRYAGGVKNVAPLVRDADLDGDRLVEYAILAGSGTVCSRLGYLLETLGADVDVSRLKEHISSSRVILDPSSPARSTGASSRWNVSINLEV